MNRRVKTAVVASVLCLGFGGPGLAPGQGAAVAAEIPTEDGTRAELPPAARRLDRALRNVAGVHAEFTAVRQVDLTGEELTSTGEVAFQRPDRFRLAYLDPDAQEVVVDRDTLWVVLPEENQALRFAFDPLAPGSELFLLFSGRAQELAALFDIRQEAWSGRSDALRLEPRAGAESYPIEELRVIVGVDGFPERIAYREITGDTVAFWFTSMTQDPPGIEAAVQVRLRPGMELIDGEELTGSPLR